MGSARTGSNPVGVGDVNVFINIPSIGYATCEISDVIAWPSGLRRQLKALVRKGVGSNPTAVNFSSTLV